jgi:hypothetical protein
MWTLKYPKLYRELKCGIEMHAQQYQLQNFSVTKLSFSQ